MALKEKFLKIETYEEFDKRREEFRGIDMFDKEIRIHANKIFGKHPSPDEELYKEPRNK